MSKNNEGLNAEVEAQRLEANTEPAEGENTVLPGSGSRCPRKQKEQKSPREGGGKVKDHEVFQLLFFQIGSQSIVRTHGLKKPVLPSEGLKANMCLT